MSELYIIQNQHNLYLDKHGEWVDGSESQSLFRTAHKDEAINIKVEHAVRSPDLRLSLVLASTNEKGHIILEAPQSPEPLPSADPLDNPSSENHSQGDLSSASQSPTIDPTTGGLFTQDLQQNSLTSEELEAPQQAINEDPSAKQKELTP